MKGSFDALLPGVEVEAASLSQNPGGRFRKCTQSQRSRQRWDSSALGRRRGLAAALP